MIRPYKEVYQETLKELLKFQKGEHTVIETGRPWLDEVLGGIINQQVITIAGASFSGKTFELHRLVKQIYNLNPNKKIVTLNNSLEMQNLAVLLRDFNIELKKS